MKKMFLVLVLAPLIRIGFAQVIPIDSLMRVTILKPEDTR
jgi:hypothetical protein